MTKQLLGPLRDVEVRKVGSVVAIVANEKQREAKEKEKGGKKKVRSYDAIQIGRSFSDRDGRADLRVLWFRLRRNPFLERQNAWQSTSSSSSGFLFIPRVSNADSSAWVLSLCSADTTAYDEALDDDLDFM